MSIPYRPTIVGLVSPGLIWLAASTASAQDSPRPQGQPSTPAPASSSTFSVLLMSNGTVVRGEIVDDPSGGVYRLKTRGGQFAYPKTSVKRVGQSIEELYRFQVNSLPPGDFDERMKLVRWCLTEHLPGQAREQLADILKSSPNDFEAQRMAHNLDAAAETGSRDPAVQQSSGEVVAGDAPAPLDQAIVKKVRRGFGNSLPEIFDLPPSVAVRRASEFAEFVQPVLQQSCASCHNEKYQGEFQLVQVRNKKDLRNPDVARANLDAALRLVDPDDPSRSDLLSAGLVPHGPNKGGIFRGANDPQYKVLATWVRSLRTTSPASASKANGSSGEGVNRTEYIPPSSATDGFGSDRQGRAGASFSTGVDTTGGKLPAFTPPGARRYVNQINESADFSGGAAGDFPVPFTVGGVEFDKAKSGAAPTGRRSAPSGSLPPLPKPKPGRPGPASAPALAEPDESPDGPAVAATTAVQVAPGLVAVDVDDERGNLPGMNQPKYPTSKPKPKPAADPTDDDDEAPKPPKLPAASPAKKKPKVDPALLEKLIKQRNAPAP